MFEFMTMEEAFVVTWVGAFILGIGLGILAYRIFEKDNTKETDHDVQ